MRLNNFFHSAVFLLEFLESRVQCLSSSTVGFAIQRYKDKTTRYNGVDMGKNNILEANKLHPMCE
jgi:hypothetical protein